MTFEPTYLLSSVFVPSLICQTLSFSFLPYSFSWLPLFSLLSFIFSSFLSSFLHLYYLNLLFTPLHLLQSLIAFQRAVSWKLWYFLPWGVLIVWRHLVLKSCIKIDCLNLISQLKSKSPALWVARQRLFFCCCHHPMITWSWIIQFNLNLDD